MSYMQPDMECCMLIAMFSFPLSSRTICMRSRENSWEQGSYPTNNAPTIDDDGESKIISTAIKNSVRVIEQSSLQ